MKFPSSLSNYFWLAASLFAQAADSANLHIIAKTGNNGIASIRPAVSIEHRASESHPQ
jgi:hypothetical protein